MPHLFFKLKSKNLLWDVFQGRIRKNLGQRDHGRTSWEAMFIQNQVLIMLVFIKGYIPGMYRHYPGQSFRQIAELCETRSGEKSLRRVSGNEKR